jgi:hypothetical protein
MGDSRPRLSAERSSAGSGKDTGKGTSLTRATTTAPVEPVLAASLRSKIPAAKQFAEKLISSL